MGRGRGKRGFLLVDRHIEKNGGSTYRELLWKAEANALCLYWGYLQRSAAWNSFMQAMRNLSAHSVPPRVCIEAHTGIDEVVSWPQRLQALGELKARLALHKVPVKVLVTQKSLKSLKKFEKFE